MDLVTLDDIKSAMVAGASGCILKSSLAVYPMRLRIIAKDGADPETVCNSRNIIVIGTSLNDCSIEVPDFIAESAVIIILHNRTGRKRYGWAIDLYLSKDLASWQGVSDNAPAELAIDIIFCLQDIWNASGCCSFIAQSAGNPKIWSLVIEAARRKLLRMIHYLVCLSGAWHPLLCPRF